MHEGMKKREYGERVREVERGGVHSLSPVNNRRHGQRKHHALQEDGRCHRREEEAALLQSDGLTPVQISFALIRSAIRAIRGSRSHRVYDTNNIPLALSEGKVDY